MSTVNVAQLIASAQQAAKVPLGSQGLQVSRVGLGCMGFGRATVSEEQAFSVLDRAVELGCTFFDTAEVYGPYRSEEVIGKWLAARPGLREHVQIATKFGFDIGTKEELAAGQVIKGVCSEPSHVKKVVEESLKRLQCDYIDLIYQHRVDPNTPIEDVAAAVKELHAEGKIKYFGLSEASVTTTKKAHAVFPVTAVQSELSLFERQLEAHVLPSLREMGIALVPFSPMGRGLLTASKPELTTGPSPRSLGDVGAQNFELAEPVRKMAKELSTSASSVALAWILATHPTAVPIPGASTVPHLEENLVGMNFTLTEEQAAKLSEEFPLGKVIGDRYYAGPATMVDTYKDL